MLQSEEVWNPKTINIKQYLNTNMFSANNRHFVIQSSQAKQLYITKVFYKQFSCHDYITKNLKQYLNTNNFSVNNRHLFIKSSQTKQLYITEVFYKQFSCHDYIKNHFS